MKLSTLLMLLLLILSCTKNDEPIDEPDLEKGLIENQMINISGTNRNYHLFVPQNHTNAPIVFLFHANKSSSDLILGLGTVREIPAPYKVWLTIAQQEQIILVVPNGTNRG